MNHEIPKSSISKMELLMFAATMLIYSMADAIVNGLVFLFGLLA
jgi:hypothetical protein